MQNRFLIGALVASVLVLAIQINGKENSALIWKGDKTVDADVSDWPLKKVLGRLAAASGWRIYVEPGLDQSVSVKFKDLPQGEALKLLLAGVNYALLPEKTGPSRLYIYKNTIGDATSLIVPELAAKPTNWLANEIIVTLAPGSKEDIDKLATELGGKVVGRAQDLNSYRLEFDDAASAEEARQKLASRRDIQTSDNYEFQRPANPQNGANGLGGNFGIDPKPVGPGEQITVALIDTAVQPLEGKMKNFVLQGVNVAGESAAAGDAPTHGTSMLQTVLNSMALGDKENVTGKVRVLPIDIYGAAGTTTTFEVAKGLQYALSQNPNVINMSLGGEGFSPVVERLLEIAYEKKVLVFASAGNTPTTQPTYPAASPYVLGVTAARSDGSIADYANRGEFIDLKAPGNSMVYFNGQRFISTGTSTATAFTSGQAAAYSARGLPPAEVAALMLNTFDVKTPPRVSNGR